jgi:NitT/TauT family transport system substrate-binding protein
VGRKPTTAVLAAFLAMAVLIAACGGDDDDDGADGTTETTESAAGNGGGNEELTPITVGILPIAALAPLWNGIAQGYYEDEGLDVTTEIGSSGAQLAPSVLNDEYQFAVGEYLSIMQARENDVGIQVVSNLVNGADAADQHINALMVKADSGIESAEDLAGKTIGVNGLGGIEEIAVRAILDDLGADSSGVEFAEIPFPDMIAAVEAGEVDVAATLEPFITLGEQAGLVNLLDPFYESIPGMPLGLFFGSEEWLAENPDLAEAFVRGLERSIEAASDTEAMKATIVANTETDAELVEEIALDQWVADIDRDKLQTVGELATTYGILEEEPNLDELIWAG